MALRIGFPGGLALQNDGLDVPLIVQCRTPRETNPKGHRGPNHFFVKVLVFAKMYWILNIRSKGPLGRCGGHVVAPAGAIACFGTLAHLWGLCGQPQGSKCSNCTFCH